MCEMRLVEPLMFLSQLALGLGHGPTAAACGHTMFHMRGVQ